MKLKRVLGLGALTFYGVGDILGAGIYALVGKVAGVVGPAAWMAFLAAFLVAALTALSYAELSARVPRAAGAAMFAMEAFRLAWLSRAVGVLVLFSGIVSMAAGSRAFAGYFSRIAPAVPEAAVILAFFLVLAALNLRGMKESSAANIVCTLIEMAGLFIVIAAGIRFVGQVDVLSVSPAEGVSPAVAVLQGGVLAFYAFIGFEDLVNVAEDAQDARRDLPRAILLSLGIGTVIYLLVTVCAVSAVGPQALAASRAPLLSVVEKGFPGLPVWLFPLIALFAVANTALLNFVMGSRVLYGLAEERMAPAVLARLHPRTSTPHVAILTVLGIVLVIAYSGTIVILAKATSVILLIVFFIVHVALIRLKAVSPRVDGAFRVPVWVPALGAVSALALAAFALVP